MCWFLDEQELRSKGRNFDCRCLGLNDLCVWAEKRQRKLVFWKETEKAGEIKKGDKGKERKEEASISNE